MWPAAVRVRIDALLRDKYGVFLATHSSETLFGQSDERWIPERYVELSSCFAMPDEDFVRLSVSYHYWNEARRNEIWEIVQRLRLQEATPGADDRS